MQGPKPFTVKYSTAEMEEPEFVQNVISVYRDNKTGEFVLDGLFDEIRLPADEDTEIVIGG